MEYRPVTSSLSIRPLAAALVFAGLAGTAGAQTYSRTEVTTYHDNTTIWVLGQSASEVCTASIPASDACDGDVVSATTFDATFALPVAQSAFGRVVNTYAFDTASSVDLGQRGTLKSVTDAAGNASTFSQWSRGIPQRMVYADASVETAVVDAATGWISSVTDQLGNMTAYEYDAMGRVIKVIHPKGDTTAWNDMNRAFVPTTTAEYGLAAGHWRETVSTGTGTTVRYYDALWRPVLVRQFDAANVIGTQSFVKSSFDSSGKPVFQSYPSTSSTPSMGTWTDYDALGRVVTVGQDTELTPSLQVSTISYGAGFTTTTTNARGFSTTTSFQAYDQPSTDGPRSISEPEGVATDIVRDPFGKPKSITRSGP